MRSCGETYGCDAPGSAKCSSESGCRHLSRSWAWRSSARTRTDSSRSTRTATRRRARLRRQPATCDSLYAECPGFPTRRCAKRRRWPQIRSCASAAGAPTGRGGGGGEGNAAHPDASVLREVVGLGAAGVSIEDYDPAHGIYPIKVATDRVKAAVKAAHPHGIVLTARAENHLYGIEDLDDTISRLQAFRRGGADVVYAPGLVDLKAITRTVDEVKAPVNVLLRPNGPSVGQLARVGVRRLSTGGSLAFAPHRALPPSAEELLTGGTSNYAPGALSLEDRRAAFEG